MNLLKTLTLCCTLFALGQHTNAQNVFIGTVLDQQKRTPIPFANIGLPGKNAGTISNEDGSFRIDITDEYLNDTLQVSSVGYETSKMPVRQLPRAERVTIMLSEKVIQLQSVTVVSSGIRSKAYVLGNSEHKGGIILTDTVHAGGAIALLIDRPLEGKQTDFSFPALIGSVRLRVLKNNWPTFRFRVRLLAVDATGLPGQDLLDKEVIITSDVRRGWVEADLSASALRVDKPFFLSFEYLLTDEERSKILEETRRFKREHPERVVIKESIVDGKVTREEVWKWADFPGVSVAVFPIARTSNTSTCYERASSFSSWEKIFAIPAAEVTLISEQ